MKQKEQVLIFSLAILKLLLHFFTNTNYGLHRDEYLYLDEANHLDWGFMEVPPLLPFLGKISLNIFGDSVFAIRLFPALFGTFMVILIGKMVQAFGGKFWAILLASLAFIFAPAYLRTNTLFQPVFLNQFWWVLSGFLLIKIVKNPLPKYWYYLGIVAGLSFLTKYSIIFYFTGLIVGILLTTYRHLFTTKYPYIAVAIATIIALPNIIWQYQYDWPVMRHMADLTATQLENVSPGGFIGDQFMMLFGGSIVWAAGLIWLLKVGSKFRYIAIAYFVTIAILLILSGKSYYALGAYPILLAAGGVGLIQFLENKSSVYKYIIIGFILIPNFFILPLGLPILKMEEMKNYISMISEYGYEEKWEDGRVYELPQDYADMIGWEEIPEKVAKIYHALSPEAQKQCQIYGGSYGHAGVLNLRKAQFNLPEAVSFNSSYAIWAPDRVNFSSQILVDNVFFESSSIFSDMILVDSIENPYARDPGYIYWRTAPKVNIDSVWQEIVKEEKYWLD